MYMIVCSGTRVLGSNQLSASHWKKCNYYFPSQGQGPDQDYDCLLGYSGTRVKVTLRHNLEQILLLSKSGPKDESSKGMKQSDPVIPHEYPSTRATIDEE